MTIEINLESNFDAIENFYTDEIWSITGAAVKASINRALTTGRKESLKEIHKKINLNSRIKTRTDFKKDNVKIFKATGSDAFTINGAIAFSASPMPMLYFARGNIDNIRQKGIKVAKRKSPKIEIFKGKKFKLKKAFIQTHKSKQIFKRKGNKAMVKQGIPSISHAIEKANIKDKIAKIMQNRFRDELEKQIKWRLDKKAKKATRAIMKKIR